MKKLISKKNVSLNVSRNDITNYSDFFDSYISFSSEKGLEFDNDCSLISNIEEDFSSCTK